MSHKQCIRWTFDIDAEFILNGVLQIQDEITTHYIEMNAEHNTMYKDMHLIIIM